MIGVDADQNYLAPSLVLTSAEKKVNAGVFTAIKNLMAGKFSSNLQENMANGGVGIGKIDSAGAPYTSQVEQGHRRDQVRQDQAADEAAGHEVDTAGRQIGNAVTDSRPPTLELKGITKKFGSVVANDRVDFDVVAGEVHALLGENGAGKSTLMSVLYGLYSPDEGEILVDGEPVEIPSPAAAIAAGIGMVHQHFMLVPVMTVAENIVLGQEPSRWRQARPEGRPCPGARAVGAVRPRGRPRRAGRGHHGRRRSSGSRSSRRSIATPGSWCSTSRPRC